MATNLTQGVTSEFIASMKEVSVHKFGPTVSSDEAGVKEAMYKPIEMLADKVKLLTDEYIAAINNLYEAKMNASVLAEGLSSSAEEVMKASIIDGNYLKKNSIATESAASDDKIYSSKYINDEIASKDGEYVGLKAGGIKTLTINDINGFASGNTMFYYAIPGVVGIPTAENYYMIMHISAGISTAQEAQIAFNVQTRDVYVRTMVSWGNWFSWKKLTLG